MDNNKMWKTLCAASAAWFLATGSLSAATPDVKTEVKMERQSLNLTQEWDKVFALSPKVSHRKVTFTNRYGITLAADMYVPKEAEGKLPAIAVSGPFGAVKEQSSGLYAMTLAERGFLTIAFDPSYTGESGGEPRYVASPDINTEDFCAAVDFLSTCDQVDAARIGILGICGWGGMALNAAAIDTRIKATVTSTMYDMSRVTANGYFDAMDADETGRYLPFSYYKGAPSPYQKDKRADIAKLNRIQLHLDDLVTRMGQQLYEGQIAAEPLVTGRSPCQWCDYGFVCCHETGIGERALEAPAKPFEAPGQPEEGEEEQA